MAMFLSEDQYQNLEFSTIASILRVSQVDTERQTAWYELNKEFICCSIINLTLNMTLTLALATALKFRLSGSSCESAAPAKVFAKKECCCSLHIRMNT